MKKLILSLLLSCSLANAAIDPKDMIVEPTPPDEYDNPIMYNDDLTVNWKATKLVSEQERWFYGEAKKICESKYEHVILVDNCIVRLMSLR